MRTEEIKHLLERQRQFFASGKSRPVAFRIAQLKKLLETLKAMEGEFLEALKQDLGKGDFEAYSSEIGFVYEELEHMLKHVASWAKPRSVGTPLLLQPSVSRIYPQPKGVVLIIGPWNYPMQLLLAPLVGAIAAGNCVVLKPSEMAPAVAQAVTRLIERTFSPDYCAVVDGAVPETTALLKEAFGHIFFTGSIPVGKIVMHAAAEHLTPVTLELGGKSPCIVDSDTDLKVTARRIAWGKFYNAGQTCVAPDHLLVHKSVKRELIGLIRQELKSFFGDDPSQSKDFARIINTHHFDRLMGLIKGDVVIGGQSDRDKRFIAPTVIDQVQVTDPVMSDEIFGPVLPVLEYEELDEVIQIIKQHPNPLALYLFTNRAEIEKRVIDEIAFGGGCINNALMHLANPNLPFGGVGQSGMGQYHGQDSFETFSHRKSVVKTSFFVDPKIKYPPYGGLGLIRRLMG